MTAISRSRQLKLSKHCNSWGNNVSSLLVLLQSVRMLDALPAIPHGTRPAPSFAGVSITPVPRCSMYASMLSQVSLASSVGALDDHGPKIEVGPAVLA